MDKNNFFKIAFYGLILVYVVILYFVFRGATEKECGQVRAAFEYCVKQYNTNCIANPFYSIQSPLNLSSFNITSEVQENGK